MTSPKLPNPCDGFKRWLAERRWRRYFRDLSKREATARARNDCREIGRLRAERRARVHAALKAVR